MTSLGAAPTDESDRGEWLRRAGIPAAYRDLRGLPADAVSLGPAPPREQAVHRLLWTRARAAAGAPADQLDYTTATDTELHRMRETYRRAAAWAPYWVTDELRDAQLATSHHHHDAVLWQAEAQLHPPGTPERARADTDTHTARHLAAIYQTRVEDLQVIDTARRQWHHHTDTIRTRSEHAGTELLRRRRPRDPAPTVTEQPPLLELPAGHEASAGEPNPAVQAWPRPARTAVAELGDKSATGHSGQTQLFDLTPDPRHVAATSALEAAAAPASEAGSAPVTLAEALRQAQISTELRAQHQHWTAVLRQLPDRTRGRSRDSAADYLRRAHTGTELDHEHTQDLDLDLGADY